MAKAIYTGVAGVARKVKQPYIGSPNFESVNLPSGYTQVEFIQSSGTQYIDTGAQLVSGLSAEIDYQPTSTESDDWFFSVLNTSGSKGWRAGIHQNAFYLVNFTASQTSNLTARTTFSGTSTNTENLNIYLFAENRNGSAYGNASGKMYSCKIYDSKGALIRNFIPCKNANGVVGMYDLVHSKFYASEGTGTFTVGSTQKSVARKVKKGYIGVNGVARLFYQAGEPLGTFPVGNTVKLNVNGVPREFIIVHQGLPSSMYDASCNGTWLLMKDVYIQNIWSSNNNYKTSTIHSYLNNSFLSLLDSGIQATIKQVKIPYHNGTGSNGSVSSGTNGLSTKIFLLSGYEVGWTKSTNTAFPVDGASLNYFSGISATNSKRIGYYNGSAVNWWLRSPTTDGNSGVWLVSTQGGVTSTSATSSNSYGVRPVLILPSDTPVPEDLLIT